MTSQGEKARPQRQAMVRTCARSRGRYSRSSSTPYPPATFNPKMVRASPTNEREAVSNDSQSQLLLPIETRKRRPLRSSTTADEIDINDVCSTTDPARYALPRLPATIRLVGPEARREQVRCRPKGEASHSPPPFLPTVSSNNVPKPIARGTND